MFWQTFWLCRVFKEFGTKCSIMRSEHHRSQSLCFNFVVLQHCHTEMVTSTSSTNTEQQCWACWQEYWQPWSRPSRDKREMEAHGVMRSLRRKQKILAMEDSTNETLIEDWSLFYCGPTTSASLNPIKCLPVWRLGRNSTACRKSRKKQPKRYYRNRRRRRSGTEKP